MRSSLNQIRGLIVVPNRPHASWLQINLYDLLCLVTLHCVLIAGISNAVIQSYVRPSKAGPGFRLVVQNAGVENLLESKMLDADAVQMIILAACVGSMFILTSYWIGRLLSDRALPRTDRSSPRVLASITCVAFFAGILFIRLDTYGPDEGGIVQWSWNISNPVARRSSFWLAAISSSILISLELFKWRRLTRDVA